jgi:hypothetical protein
MNAAQLVREVDRVGRLLELTRDIEALIPKTGNSHLALALLACQETRPRRHRHNRSVCATRQGRYDG